MGPSRGNFWRSGRSGRPVQARRGASSELRRASLLRALWNTGHGRGALRTAPQPGADSGPCRSVQTRFNISKRRSRRPRLGERPRRGRSSHAASLFRAPASSHSIGRPRFAKAISRTAIEKNR
ncbi:hypothetical protein D4764_17G0003580 [Takifugu flavidus]|uniref:Uncharacterized protein n=1 Tax=Takifugu flavidus TaxID=433684 RepID=A0A5C6NVB6_9TELE|nr:hypothetical protein D4764_17G0003580 [Takifugu flavidus]